MIITNEDLTRIEQIAGTGGLSQMDEAIEPPTILGLVGRIRDTDAPFADSHESYQDLEARALNAHQSLVALASGAGDDQERRRLIAKAEGVHLVVEFMAEHRQAVLGSGR